jgi:hypothetical protein
MKVAMSLTPTRVARVTTLKAGYVLAAIWPRGKMGGLELEMPAAEAIELGEQLLNMGREAAAAYMALSDAEKLRRE